MKKVINTKWGKKSRLDRVKEGRNGGELDVVRASQQS